MTGISLVPGLSMQICRPENPFILISIQFSCGASGIVPGNLPGYEFLSSRDGRNPPSKRTIRFGVVVCNKISVLLLNNLLQIGLKGIGFTAISPLFETFLRITVVLGSSGAFRCLREGPDMVISI